MKRTIEMQTGRLLLALTVVLSLFGPLETGTGRQPVALQPYLAYLAAQEPETVVSLMGNSGQGLPAEHPGNVVSVGGARYFRMSGASMVAGVVALLLQDVPRLTPDQVKYRLMATANKSWGGYSASTAGAGYLDVAAAINGNSTQSANTGLRPAGCSASTGIRST